MHDERHEGGKKERMKERNNTSYVLERTYDILYTIYYKQPTPCSNTELRHVSHLLGVHPFRR